MAEPLALPPLYCPFPPALHPAVEQQRALALAWVQAHRLIQGQTARRRYERAQYHLLAARVCPTAALDDLLIVTGWHIWLFIVDDHCDESGLGSDPGALRALFAGYLALLDDPAAPVGHRPLATSLADLWQRSVARTSGAWAAQFRRHLADYFAGCVWEAANRQRGLRPVVTEYIAMRTASGAFLPALDASELALDIVLAPEVRAMPIVQRLTLMAGNVVCWSNDLFSLAKEVRHGDVHNLVLALHHEHGITVAEAVAQAAQLHDLEVRQFLALERLVPSLGAETDAQLRRYDGALRAWMRGNLDWGRDSGRYRVPAHARAAAPAYLEPAIIAEPPAD